MRAYEEIQLDSSARSWRVKKEGYCGLLYEVFVAPSQVENSTIDDQIIWACVDVVPGFGYTVV